MRPFRKQEQGVIIVEYAIMLALVGIAVAGAAPNIQAAVAVFCKVLTSLYTEYKREGG